MGKPEKLTWKEFAQRLPGAKTLLNSITTDAALPRVTVEGNTYYLYTIDKNSAEGLKKTTLDATDEQNIGDTFKNRLSNMSSEIESLSEENEREIIANLFAATAVEYAINKNKQAKDIVLAAYKDFGDWARHYSTVRLSLGTFFVTAGFAILSLWKDERNLYVALSVLGLLSLGVALFVIFTLLTYSRMNKQREKLRELGTVVRDVPLWARILDTGGLPIFVLLVYLAIIRLWCGLSWFPLWPPDRCVVHRQQTGAEQAEKKPVVPNPLPTMEPGKEVVPEKKAGQ